MLNDVKLIGQVFLWIVDGLILFRDKKEKHS